MRIEALLLAKNRQQERQSRMKTLKPASVVFIVAKVLVEEDNAQ